ncbi:hypothetical protein D7B24_009162 [Verticillium nonalfalfae]|uniref:RING-type E3 ubiquitin transferase n=1 Tax=Verticillium nonalfalfae TaxID=1051616 RepID=A0A3M9YHS6_9PEZI|nr:uncharacterized protein D7B24_009162 [Verticillium nonalfalfae]RNJ60133.1 hypothetical protein D7B24_009162 [Verticillium nonalfalfae]
MIHQSGPFPTHTLDTPSSFISLAFRALRTAGLLAGLGLTALAAYQRNQEEANMNFQDGSRARGDREAGLNREVVYCHACEHEWEKDTLHGLISQENDPRDFHDAPSPLSSGDGPRGPRRADSDSDPDEADIEEHLHQGPHGFNVHRSTWGHPHGDEQGGRQPPDPANGDQVIGRFLELLSTFGNGAQGGPDFDHDHPQRPPQPFGSSPFGGSGNVRTFTTRRGNGFTSFTIATGPIHVQGGGRARAFGRPSEEQGQGQGQGQGNDDFQSVFSNILTGAGPPQQPHGEDMPGQGPRPRAAGTQNLAASLHQILNMLAPGNGQFGDAVYTQEALDRIISNMMETNPQSNAAPPASEDAIGKLQRKAVDDDMLGPEGTAECTICIDELKKGEEVVYLPCKHWFHDTCVVMWLKEHNTCPICRTPIEERTESASDGQQGDGGEGSGRPAPGPSNSAPPGGGQPPPFFGFGMPSPHGDGAPPPNSTGGRGYAAPPQPPHPSTRPVHTRQFHWSFQLPQNGPAGNTRGEGSSRSPRGYDIFPPRPYDSQSSSRQSSQRRHSMSPPATNTGSRTRQRSPTPSSWNREHQQAGAGQGQNQTPSQGGPLSWLRNRLSRSGPSDGPPPDGESR